MLTIWCVGERAVCSLRPLWTGHAAVSSQPHTHRLGDKLFNFSIIYWGLIIWVVCTVRAKYWETESVYQKWSLQPRVRDKPCDSITVVQSCYDETYQRGFLTVLWLLREKSWLSTGSIRKGLFCRVWHFFPLNFKIPVDPKLFGRWIFSVLFTSFPQIWPSSWHAIDTLMFWN